MKTPVNVNAQKALIFRIAHIENFNAILDHGLRCRNSAVEGITYRSIGDTDLIDKRAKRSVPIEPWGTLSDYVPFYFTYASPMLLNIKSGRRVPHCPNSKIVFFATSLHKLKELGIRFVFTDRHAYLMTAQFSSDPEDLNLIDWSILQKRDFSYDAEDPRKMERYMAEALVYRVVPLDGLLGVACYNEQVAGELRQAIAARGLTLQVYVRPGWYF